MPPRPSTAGSGAAHLQTLDYSTAEAVLRAHIAYLRARIDQEECTEEKRLWESAVDELGAVFPSLTFLTGLSSTDFLALVVLPILAVVLVLALGYCVTLRCTGRSPVSFLAQWLQPAFMRPFAQRRLLRDWRASVRAAVPWIDDQARAQAKADRLTARFRERHLRWSFAMLLVAELVLVALNLLPDVVHWGVRRVLGPLGPFLDRLFASVVGSAQAGKGSTYGVVRATETLYILYYAGPILLSCFFGILLCATDSARVVLDMLPVQSMVPTLRENFARRRHAEQCQHVQALAEKVEAQSEALRLVRETHPLVAIQDAHATVPLSVEVSAPAEGAARGETDVAAAATAVAASRVMSGKSAVSVPPHAPHDAAEEQGGSEAATVTRHSAGAADVVEEL